jgi:hypothetical protein
MLNFSLQVLSQPLSCSIVSPKLQVLDIVPKVYISLNLLSLSLSLCCVNSLLIKLSNSSQIISSFIDRPLIRSIIVHDNLWNRFDTVTLVLDYVLVIELHLVELANQEQEYCNK